ncbi:hypothetical protein ACEWY4_023343 [Coilia grayii]|uniref:Acid-sensing ion channel 4 n=1 Tax=Coilia grayii TaxID=363190 RepID=A0ABD1J4N2_9TELE
MWWWWRGVCARVPTPSTTTTNPSHPPTPSLPKVYTRYGKCYTFNGNKTGSRKTKQGGMGNGLEIMLDIQQDEYLPIWKETNETSLEAGIRVQIHSQDEPPYIHQLGFGVSPGFQTFVSCQEQRLTYLPQPWGNCRSTMDQLIPGYETYSISACRLHCESMAVLKECNCRMVHMPALLQKSSGDTCPCETPCNLTRYGKELSMVKIPSRGSARYLSRKYDKTEEYIRDNFLVLDIFFEALNYETIEQKKAYDVAGLLGDIGGQMGLFIGASILTVLEILDYLYEVMKHRMQRLLRPAKEEEEKKRTAAGATQKPSTVATVRLEETKPKFSPSSGSKFQSGYSSFPLLVPLVHHHHVETGQMTVPNHSLDGILYCRCIITLSSVINKAPHTDKNGGGWGEMSGHCLVARQKQGEITRTSAAGTDERLACLAGVLLTAQDGPKNAFNKHNLVYMGSQSSGLVSRNGEGQEKMLPVLEN